MEPMTLGSPSGSPANAGAQYLPPFLLGETQPPSTPRNSTLSPNKNKAGRNVSFAVSPGASSPSDYNRSALGHRNLFGGSSSFQQQMTPNRNYGGTPARHNSCKLGAGGGPPTQGLFDSLREERNQVQTPTSPVAAIGSSSGLNQSYQQQLQQPWNPNLSLYNESSHLGNASFNRSVFSPCLPVLSGTPPVASAPQMCAEQDNNEFWVTVFGFPTSATSTILQHFSQCGTIVDKIFSPQSGNWVHLRYSSRLECNKAMNYNEKILANNIMIGVTLCKHRHLMDKENQNDINSKSITDPERRGHVRSLTQSISDQMATSKNSAMPSSGLMNKAIDLLFGW